MRAFDGKTYEPAFDRKRLFRALRKIFDIMCDHDWHTIHELAQLCCISETSASARIRDLRKERFGSFEVKAQRVNDGIWQYRLTGKRFIHTASQLELQLT